MAASPISSNTQELRNKTQAFTTQTTTQLGVLQAKTLSTSNVELQHREILGIFTRTMDEAATLKTTIHQNTTLANQDAMFEALLPVTEAEEQLGRIFRRYNDTLLTYYPTAKIAYGRACIGPKTPCATPISGCTLMREIRGDGNCFLSAFTARLLETKLAEGPLEGNLMHLILGDKLDLPELRQEIMEKLSVLSSDPSQIETFLQDNANILPFISYFRHLAAREIQTKASQFEWGLKADLAQISQVSLGAQSLDTLVREYVIPMGIDFSHPMILALCQRVDFQVKIIDPKLGVPDGLNILEEREPQATFCRSGEHYYVLYPQEEARQPTPVSLASLFGHTSINAGNGAGPLQLADTTQYKPVSTQITITCTAPEGAKLFIRGEGGGLNWQHGAPVKWVAANTWVYTTEVLFQELTYKILIDDIRWQNGPNLKISHGKQEQIAPNF